MLIVSYDKRKVLHRIVPFQIIGIMLIVLLARLGSGDLRSDSPKTITLILSFGLLLYIFFTYVMIAIIRNPVILRISDSGMLQWTSFLGNRKVYLMPGTLIKHDRGRVLITPSVNGIPHAKTMDGGTELSLPSGLHEIPYGEFFIKQGALS